MFSVLIIHSAHSFLCKLSQKNPIELHLCTSQAGELNLVFRKTLKFFQK